MAPRWDPEDRLALLDLMASFPTSASESFFIAHNLGIAYGKPGQYASKRRRINSALDAASRAGRIDQVLDAAADAFNYTATTHSIMTEAQVPGNIFVSHASHDQNLAQLLVNTIVLGGFPTDNIFYSSQRGTGISPGRDVRSSLRENLGSASLVVVLISETFLTRPYCLMELGGAWVTEKPTFPIIVPPATRTEVARTIGDVQYATLGDSEDVDSLLADLSDQIQQHTSASLKASNWNKSSSEFKAKYSDVISDLHAQGKVITSQTQSDFNLEGETGTQSAPDRQGGQGADENARAELYGVSAGNITIEHTSHSTEVMGEATNSNPTHKTAILTATFYGESGKIIGRATGMASDIGPRSTNSFTLSSLKPITNYARVSLQFDSIF